MQIQKRIPKYISNKGVTLVFTAICIFMLITFAALSLDIFHLVYTRNELQNAADAGALAGARYLYNDAGTSVNAGCNAIAKSAAKANNSDNISVDVADSDVQRGHWSFHNKTFTPNDSLDPVDLWNVTTEALDANTNFINAVKVTAWRKDTQVSAWFSKIMGFLGFTQSAKAVAYIGFAGTLKPGDVDQPIAVCKDSILYSNMYSCNVGRMLNDNEDTARWTNFQQSNSNCDSADANEVKGLVCKSGNTESLKFGLGTGVMNGTAASVFDLLESCWINASNKNRTWELTLPVVECTKPPTCDTLKGAVTLKIVWIERNGNPKYDEAPTSMTDSDGGSWPSSADLQIPINTIKNFFVPDKNENFPNFTGTVGDHFAEVSGDNNQTKIDKGMVRWASFVNRFQLKNAGDPATAAYASFSQKSIYFLPSCKPHEPKGTSEGENFGILAKIPVLVQ